MTIPRAKTFELTSASLALVGLLAACGGGGTDTAAPPSSSSAALTLNGVAATGAAISGKTVEAKCSTGTGTATSNADGSYTVTVASGSLPCVLKVTPASGPALYSIATGTGSTATANINPVTQLVVASLIGATPDTYFTAFDSTAAAGVTTAKVSTAVSAVKATLLAAGLDLGAIDVLAGTLTPATSNTTGNAYDQALDALAAKLTSSGTTLATLTSTVAATSTTNPPPASTSTTATASLPAELLLKPAATQCAALRSGSYRIMLPAQGSTLAAQYGKITIDAPTLGVTYTDGSTGTWAAHPTEACHFTDDAGKSDIVVSPAGVIVMRYFDDSNSSYKAAVAFPDQNHTLAELEGTWNMLGLAFDDVSGAYIGDAATANFSATGTLSAVSHCQNASTWSVATCVAVTSDLSSLRANADGGFDALDAGSTVASGRTFAYRSGSGDLMMAHVDGDGSFEVRTKQRSLGLPAVGRVNTNWDLRFTNHWLSTNAIAASTNTVTALDATAVSYVRRAKTVGGTDEHLETVFADNPRAGYNFRPAVTVLGTDGTTSVSVVEWTNLGLRGMGLTALTRPSQKQFMFSVQQP